MAGIFGLIGGIANGVTGIFAAKENRKALEVKGKNDLAMIREQKQIAAIKAESDKLNALMQVRMGEQKAKENQLTLAYVGAFVIVLLIFFKN